jgi:ribose transport system permease protein
VDPFFKDVLRGVVIIAAVAIYARRQIDRKASRPRFGPNGNGGNPPPEPTPPDPVPAKQGAHP